MPSLTFSRMAFRTDASLAQKKMSSSRHRFCAFLRSLQIKQIMSVDVSVVSLSLSEE